MKGSTLRLVLCRAGAIRLALDANQVREIRPYDSHEGHYPWFDELVPCPRGSREADIPFLLAFEAKARVPGVVVSKLEDVAMVAFRDVRPLPPLVARFAEGFGLWGMVLVGGIPRFLFDPEGISAGSAAAHPTTEHSDERDPHREDRWKAGLPESGRIVAPGLEG